MKKTLLIAIGLIVLLAVSAGSYIYFSLPDKAAAPKGKPNAEGVFESKRELNPSGTKAFYFTSTSDITAKSPFDICYDGNSSYKIRAFVDNKSEEAVLVPVVEDVASKTKTELKSLGAVYNQDSNVCYFIQKWASDSELYQKQNSQSFSRLDIIDISKEEPKIALQYFYNGEAVDIVAGDRLLSQKCGWGKCGNIELFKNKGVKLATLKTDAAMQLDFNDEFNIENLNKKVRITSGDGFAVVDLVGEQYFMENTISTISKNWQSYNYYSDEKYFFTLKYPKDWKVEDGPPGESLDFFENGKISLSIREVQGQDVEKEIRTIREKEKYGTVSIQETSAGNFWGKELNFDNGKSYAFVPAEDRIFIFQSDSLEGMTWNAIKDELYFDFDMYALFSSGKYYSQRSYKMVHVQYADFDQNGENERVVSYQSDDELTTNEGRTNGHLKVFDKSGKVLKDDTVVLRGGASDSRLSSFSKIQVIDFGNDGKPELFVQKTDDPYYQGEYSSGSSERYYVFGYFDGKYGDYPISKGNLNPEKYFNCTGEKNKIALDCNNSCTIGENKKMADITITLNSLAVDPDGVTEKYSFSNGCGGGDAEGIFQRFEKGKFSGEIMNFNKTKPVSDEYFVKDGFVYHKDKKMIDQKLDDIVAHTGEGIIYSQSIEGDKYVDLYLVDGKGCGGCVWFLPTIIRINKSDDTYEFIDTSKAEKDQVFFGGSVLVNLPSPDKKKVAFISNTERGAEELWVYDSVSMKQSLLKTFPKEETFVVIQGAAFMVGVEWLDNGTLSLRPIEKR
jgi:hypothetical protein